MNRTSLGITRSDPVLFHGSFLLSFHVMEFKFSETRAGVIDIVITVNVIDIVTD